MILLFVLLVGIALFAFGITQNVKRQERRKKEYIHALNLLRKNPSNTILHMQALKAGREFYSTLRHKGKLTTKDEVAINNDIKANIEGI